MVVLDSAAGSGHSFFTSTLSILAPQSYGYPGNVCKAGSVLGNGGFSVGMCEYLFLTAYYVGAWKSIERKMGLLVHVRFD